MRSALLTAFLGLLCLSRLSAFDVQGTIKKVDAEKGSIVVFAAGAQRTLKIDAETKVFGADGKPLADGIKAKEVKEGAEGVLSVDKKTDEPPVLKAFYLGKQLPKNLKKGAEKEPTLTAKSSVGLKPLNEMTAEDRYKGEDGGLYGGGKNEPPAAHAAAAKEEAAKIVPLDGDGKPSPNGAIAVVSLSMSNATMEYSTFKKIADKDPAKSPQATIVDCAQGGATMMRWADPKGLQWTEADKRLAAAGVSPKQVQVVWVKLANGHPTGELAEHGQKLQKDTTILLNNAKERFPNLRIAFLSGRIYGGYASNALNPEPYAYEGNIVCRWMIQSQIKGDAALNYDPAKGAVKSPLLLWGPYLWGDGVVPRKSDGLVWERKDLIERDGTHPSDSGREKVANMLLNFFRTDPFTKSWFVKQ